MLRLFVRVVCVCIYTKRKVIKVGPPIGFSCITFNVSSKINLLAENDSLFNLLKPGLQRIHVKN